MKHQNFYIRVLNVILIIGILLFYNLTLQNHRQQESVDTLTAQVSSLQEQQEELLSALKISYEAREAAAKAAEEKAAKERASAEAAAEKKAQESADTEQGVYAEGIFIGEGSGFGGTIQVQITIAEQQLTDIHVISAPGEDAAYLSMAQGVIDTILSSQSTAVDTVSGATFSSTGILMAVDNALAKAENS